MDFKNVFFNVKDYILDNTKLLGSGSFGQVCVAKKIGDDQNLYAAKIIIINDNYDGDKEALIMREAWIMSELKHHAIVKFYGINFRSFDDKLNFQPIIITEFLPHDLETILKAEQRCNVDHKWTPTKKYICLLGIADGMRYLHDNDIIHRDLKPGNILLDEDFNPKICDFGLSRFLPDEFTSTVGSMTNAGTPLYMAPEVFDNEGDVPYDESIDVYSFGMLAYQLVTGKKLYYELFEKGITSFRFCKKVKEGARPTFTKSGDVPKKMQDLISSCWDPDPNARPTFKYIFETLKSDLSYSPEQVDEREIAEYLDSIADSENKTPKTIKMKKKLKDSEERIHLIEQKNAESEAKLNDIELENNQLQEKLKQSDERLQMLEQTSNEKQNKLNEVELRNKELEGQLKEAERKIQFLESKSIEDDEKLHQFEQRNKELQYELNNAERKIKMLEQLCMENEDKYKETQRRNKDIAKSLNDAENKASFHQQKHIESEQKLSEQKEISFILLNEISKSKKFLYSSSYFILYSFYSFFNEIL